jgi:hypothetical protein
MEKRSFDLACFAFACAGAEFLIYGPAALWNKCPSPGKPRFKFRPKICILRRKLALFRQSLTSTFAKQFEDM